jgi:hypothetical protein
VRPRGAVRAALRPRAVAAGGRELAQASNFATRKGKEGALDARATAEGLVDRWCGAK